MVHNFQNYKVLELSDFIYSEVISFHKLWNFKGAKNSAITLV